MENLLIQASSTEAAPVTIAFLYGQKLIRSFRPGMAFVFQMEGQSLLELGAPAISLSPGEAGLFCAPEVWQCQMQQGNAFFIQMEEDLLLRKMLPLISDCPVVMEFLIQIMRSEKESHYLHFYNGAERADMVAPLRRMLYEYQNRRPSYRAAMQSELISLIAQLSRNYWVRTKAQSMQGSTLMGELLVYMSEQLGSATLESAAQHLNYHPNTISALCKRELGKPFSVLQKELRLKRAHDLLEETGLSVAAIAELCGYTHLTSFYKAFKAQYGATPRNM